MKAKLKVDSPDKVPATGFSGDGDSKIQIYIVDDQPVYITGLKDILRNHPDIKFSGSFNSSSEALTKTHDIKPDVILVGLNTPYMNGTRDIISFRKKLSDSKILVLSIHKNENYVQQIIKMGASGYIMKNSLPEEIVEAIKSVHNNIPYFSFGIEGKKLIPDDTHLTRREIDVLILIVGGLTNKEIANKLNISVRTVETHRDHLTQKLKIKNVAELTKYAIANGLIRI